VGAVVGTVVGIVIAIWWANQESETTEEPGESETETDNKKPGDGTSNVDKPGEAQQEIGAAQDQSRKNRPSVQSGDWEGSKSRPKANDIESTKKSDDRARHDRQRNWQDEVDEYNEDQRADET
jgi:hypothetical protein